MHGGGRGAEAQGGGEESPAGEENAVTNKQKKMMGETTFCSFVTKFPSLLLPVSNDVRYMLCVCGWVGACAKNVGRPSGREGDVKWPRYILAVRWCVCVCVCVLSAHLRLQECRGESCSAGSAGRDM